MLVDTVGNLVGGGAVSWTGGKVRGKSQVNLHCRSCYHKSLIIFTAMTIEWERMLWWKMWNKFIGYRRPWQWHTWKVCMHMQSYVMSYAVCICRQSIGVQGCWQNVLHHKISRSPVIKLALEPAILVAEYWICQEE